MLEFQWNALRRGDVVFVHDASEPGLGRRAGVIALVDVRRGGHDLGVRFTTGTTTGPVVRPGRFAVHLADVDDDDCWRCRDNREPPADTVVRPDAELVRGR